MKKILVVDDETNIRNLIKNILSDEFEVITAANGLEALELLKSGGFDLIILDIDMPHMDGVELVKELKKFNSSMPVIVISTLSEPEKIVDIFKMATGANFDVDFVIKPFSSDDIATATHRIIDLQKKKEIDIDSMIKEVKQLINLGENSKAREKTLELLKLLPSSPIPHFLLGSILEKEGKIEEAKKHFQAALVFDPSYDPAKKKLKNIGG